MMKKKFVIILCALISLFVICFLNFKNIKNSFYILESLKNTIIVNKYVDSLIKKNTYSESYDKVKFTWDNEPLMYSWKYYNAIFMKALLKHGYYDYVDNFYKDNILDSGKVIIPQHAKPYYSEETLDNISVSRPLFYLLDSKYSKKYLLNIDYAYKKLKSQPILKNAGGNYVHKVNNKKWEKYQFALDGVYMSLPFLLEYDKYILKKINKSTTDDIYNRMLFITKILKNSEGLYSHGCSKDGIPNGIVWLRGAAWYAMAQVEIIELFPEGSQKEILKKNLKEFFDSLIKYQDNETGMWYNVIYPKLNSKYQQCNLLESAGSAMVAYSLMEAFNNGIVNDTKYAYAALKAFNGILKYNFERDGFLDYKLKNIYLFSNVNDKETVSKYCKCSRYIDDDVKGIAPLLMASDNVYATCKKLIKLKLKK